MGGAIIISKKVGEGWGWRKEEEGDRKEGGRSRRRKERERERRGEPRGREGEKRKRGRPAGGSIYSAYHLLLYINRVREDELWLLDRNSNPDSDMYVFRTPEQSLSVPEFTI